MRKISKKDLSLNKEVIASLSENEMLQVMGGEITGEVTLVESICLCKTIGEIGCTTLTPGCDATRHDCSVGCIPRGSDVCGPTKVTMPCTGNGCAFITDYDCVSNDQNCAISAPNCHSVVNICGDTADCFEIKI